jgi:Flp pilus assembly protein TadD
MAEVMPPAPDEGRPLGRDDASVREASWSVERAEKIAAVRRPAFGIMPPPPADPTATFDDAMGRALDLEHSGKYAEAKTAYRRLIDRFPERCEPYHRLGMIADREKRPLEAQTLYRRAIGLNPTCADLYNDLGYCLFLQGRLPEAEVELHKAVELAPDNPRYHNNLGLVYGYQRRREDALAQFRRGGTEADALYNLAFVLAAGDDRQGAKDHYRLAQEADADAGPAAQTQ